MRCIPRARRPFLIKVFLFLVLCFATLLLISQSSYSSPVEVQRDLAPVEVQRDLAPVEVQNDLSILTPSKSIRQPRANKHLGRNATTSPEELEVEEIQRRIPSLPIEFWYKHHSNPLRYNSTCAKFPDLYSIEFNNDYWQTLRTTNGTFQLFGAYLDVRRNNKLGPTVRILAMLDRINPEITTYCQFWFTTQKKPVIVKTAEYRYIWVSGWGNYRQGIYQPYLLACVIPPKFWNLTLAAVSLVENQCDNANNGLTVIYNKPKGEKKDFAVCVKGMAFPKADLSVKLAEWIELLHLLGADKIFMYELEVHPNVSKLLDYYENQGKVHVTRLKLPGALPNAPFLQSFFLKNKLVHKRQNELIPYNDCFYKHMYEYKYIVLLDTDEVIMPIQFPSWKELIENVSAQATKEKKVEWASFNARNVYFLDDLLHDHGWFDHIPRYMHMLQHVYRTENYTKPGYYIKSFHNTERVLILHNHYPLACLGSCYSYAIDTLDAHLQHYRSDCVNDLKKSCSDFRNHSVKDTSIWRFEKPLIERVESTLKDLGFI